MKKIIHYSLVFSLIFGLILMAITFFQIYKGYQNFSYKENLLKLLQFTSSYRFRLNCYTVWNNESFVVNNHIKFYLKDYDQIKKINFEFIPMKEEKKVFTISYHPNIVVLFYMNPSLNSEGDVMILPNMPQFQRVCRLFSGTSFRVEVTNLSRQLSCDNPENLFEDYKINCLQKVKDSQIIGHLGEKVTCDYKIINDTSVCTTFITLDSYDEYTNYLNDCKNKCFKIPDRFSCIVDSVNYYMNLMFQFIKHFMQKGSDLVLIKPNGETISFVAPLDEDSLKNTLNSLKTEAFRTSLPFDKVLFTSAKNLVNDLYNINMHMSKKEQKNFIIFFSQETVEKEICDVMQKEGISLIVVHLNKTTNLQPLLTPGCHFVSLNASNLNDILSFIQKFSDYEGVQYTYPKKFFFQFNPAKPELVLDSLEKEALLNISMSKEFVGLPITIQVDGIVKVVMHQQREICGASIISNESE